MDQVENTSAENEVTKSGSKSGAFLLGTAMVAVGVGLGFIVGKRRGMGQPAANSQEIDSLRRRMDDLQGRLDTLNPSAAS